MFNPHQYLLCFSDLIYTKERSTLLCYGSIAVQNSSSHKSVFTKKLNVLFAFLFLIAPCIVSAQPRPIDKKKFFIDEQLIEVTLVADFKKLISDKMKKDYKQNFIPASIAFLFPDSTKLTEAVEIRCRGKFRREECDLPSVMVNFKTPGAVKLKKLGRLKLVWPCGYKDYDEQLVLKEYLVYKIYNLLTEKSFRVRLVKMTCYDSKEKTKPYTSSYAFFIEEVDNMAARNNCEEVQGVKFHTERTNRPQTTLVSLFEYMIGNCDWAIPIYQNIKLISSKEDSLLNPFAVPYDFDYCGLVNAEYAIPPPELPIANVRQRLYRGFPRSLEELQSALQIFRSQKQAMNSMIQNFTLLTKANKKEMIKYLDEFFEQIEKEKDIKDIFIKNARTE